MQPISRAGWSDFSSSLPSFPLASSSSGLRINSFNSGWKKCEPALTRALNGWREVALVRVGRRRVGSADSHVRVLKRVLVMVGAYVVGVLGFCAALALLFGVASLLPDSLGYWVLPAVSPAIFVAAPVAGLFVVLLAIVLSAGPALLILAVTEVLGWRSPYVYVVPTALLSAAVYLELSPRTIGGLDGAGMIEATVFGLSGACSGLIYWAIAGRRAGSWRHPARPAL